MSVLSESIYAQNRKIEGRQLDVVGTLDEDLIKKRQQIKEMQEALKNQNEKNKIQAKMNKYLKDLIPGQIIMEEDEKKFNKLIETRDQYLECSRRSEEENCTELKSQLDSLIDTNNRDDQNFQENFFIYENSLAKIKRCVEVTREDLPDFSAIISLDIIIDQNGFPSRVKINSDETTMNYNIPIFGECVAYFAREINLKNPQKQSTVLTKKFIF